MPVRAVPRVPETWLPILLFTAGGALVLVAVVGAAHVPPRVALAAYAFVLPFGSAVTVPLLPHAFGTLSTLVGVAATMSLLLHLLVRRRGPLRVHPSVGGWLLLLGWLALTLLWTADPSRSRSALVILTSLVALHTIASLTPFDRKDLRLLELATVAGALVVAGRGAVLGATGALNETASQIPRATFDEGDPNITAATLLLAFVLTVWWALNEKSTPVRAASLGAALLILVGGITLAGSRGGLVAAAVGFLAVLAQTARLSPARLVAFLGLVAVSVAVAWQVMPPELQNHLRATHSTGRVAIWEVGLRSCPDTCLLGNGAGTFGRAYRETYYSDLTVPGNGDALWAAHNTFLSMLVEGGVIGATLLVGSFVLLIGSLVRLPAAWRGPPLAAVAALVASNMLLTNLNFKYFWLTLTYATLVVHAHYAARQRPPATPVPEERTAPWPVS